MYAIIETGGKQYRVEQGDILYIEKLNVNTDDVVTFDKVIVLENKGKAKIGAPYVKGATVTAKVQSQSKLNFSYD